MTQFNQGIVQGILVFATCTIASEHTQNLHINTPINKASGIYLEKVGVLGKSTSSWKFIIHFDFTNHETEEQLLRQKHSALVTFCNKLVMHVPWEPCKVSMKAINSTLQEVIDNNNLLRQLFRLPSKTKRGLVNGIGRLSKFLFGTMDDEDAIQIEKALNRLSRGQNKLQHNINSRMSVMINSIETLSKSTAIIKDQLQILEQKMSIMGQEVQNRTQFGQTLHLFDEVSNLMTLSMGRFLSKQAELTDILHEAKLGKLDKHLTNSPLLLNALKEVQLELPRDLQLPLKPTIENTQLFDRIAQVDPLYALNNLTLSISIPLVNDFYQLYRLTTIPAKHKDELYYFIRTNSQYVAINEKSKQYIFLKEGELDKCTDVDHELYICKANFLLYNQNSQNCIIRIILNDQDLSKCELRVFRAAHEMWYPLSRPNSWLYVVPYEINVRIICDDVAYSVKIIESGILELYPGCKASTNQVNLETLNEVKSAKQMLYHFNSTFIDDELNLTQAQMNSKPIQIPARANLENTDLDKISISLNELRRNDLDYVEIENTEPKPSNTAFYIVLIALILVLFANVIHFVMKKVIKCKVAIVPPNGNQGAAVEDV